MYRESRLFIRGLLTVALLALLGACTTYRESEPGRTATEQLLFSAAVDRVCNKLALQIPENSKVFVDATYVEGTDSKYLVASLRDRILRHGGHLVAARDQADLVFEPRVGALSVDRKNALVGIPSIPIPIPLVGNLALPEIALFKRDRQQGVVKLALTSYDARTGEVLMLAYMNEESLKLTLQCGEAVYYSRSRKELWHKGKTSGHVQKVHSLLTDCDQDAIVLKVEQVGAGCCHVGYPTCFYRRAPVGDELAPGTVPLIPTTASKSYDPDAVYGKNS